MPPHARVLDIGTGSGLLALLAARAGAATVTACEVFPSVARAAARVVRGNGYDQTVRVRPTRELRLPAVQRTNSKGGAGNAGGTAAVRHAHGGHGHGGHGRTG
jgi:ribosomal protein L11 methylase PrmA